MKNQYFGDINDYRKYGLLRGLLAGSPLRLLVAWMLTPSDGRTDGKFTEYLTKPNEFRRHDPELFDALRGWLASGAVRSVAHIERSELLPQSRFFSEIVPDGRQDRDDWFRRLRIAATDADVVFLDPDNGLEVKSSPYGRKSSSKFAFWREVEELAEQGKSLVIYQHFRREKRDKFIARMERELRKRTGVPFVTGLRTSGVLFLVAAHKAHRAMLEAGVARVRERWVGQIE